MVLHNRHIHLVSFDIPYPPNYGGAVDVFYKIKAFHNAGIKVHLHCFEYGRKKSQQLNALCEKVHYYHRKTTKSLLFNDLPYIVLSRTSESLFKNLSNDNYPILMEGLHCCYYLGNKKLSGRKTIVRTHNIEHEYYTALASVENNVFKRYYFYNEATKLKRFESILSKASAIAAISPNDTQYLSKNFSSVHYIPAFHPFQHVISKEGRGTFALYHGNLSVGENNEAALYLTNKVFNDIKFPLIIAGSHPSDQLKNEIKKRSNITLRANISTEEMHRLIKDAHINVLPTFQATGIKLKLLAALFSGRHCIVNNPMVENTGLKKLCVVSDTPREMKKTIKKLFQEPFSKDTYKKRELILQENFSNEKNIEKLLRLFS